MFENYIINTWYLTLLRVLCSVIVLQGFSHKKSALFNIVTVNWKNGFENVLQTSSYFNIQTFFLTFLHKHVKFIFRTVSPIFYVLSVRKNVSSLI